jgi:peptidoglycan hydrolase-like protein with peptidoglycan-binding domain
MANGAIVAISSYNHIGFRTSGSGSTFRLLSGNSTDGSSSDAVTLKTYSVSVISGYVNLTYAPAAPADPNAYPGTVYKYVKSKLMTGSHVKWIQEHLNAKGASPKLDTDGAFGTKTRDEVKDFQAKNGLTKDGQVGPKTWAKLAA